MLKKIKRLLMLKVHLALIFVQVAYGGLHVILKSSLSAKNKNLSFCVWRDLIALLVLIPFAYYSEKGKRPKLTKNAIFYLIILGITGIFGNQLLFLCGLNYTSPIIAASFQPSIPVFTLIISIVMGMEVLNAKRYDGKLKILGILFCIAGAFVITTFQESKTQNEIQTNLLTKFKTSETKTSAKLPEPEFGISEKLKNRSKFQNFENDEKFRSDESNQNRNQNGNYVSNEVQSESQVSFLYGLKIDSWHFGVLYLVGNCCCMAAYLVLQSSLLRFFPAPITITAISYLFGSIFLFFFGIISIEYSDWWLLNSQIMAVLYAGLIASALNYSLLTWTNKMVGASMVALYMPLQPFTSAILSFIFLGSRISLGSVVGGFSILFGLYCVTWGKSESDKLLVMENIK